MLRCYLCIPPVRYLVLFIVAMCFLSSSPTHAQSSASWLGGAGDWFDPSNISGGCTNWDICADGKPSPSGNFDIFISIAGSAVTLNSTAVVTNLTLVSGNSLVATSTSALNFEGTGGTTLSNAGSIELKNGSSLNLSGVTSLTISGGGTIALDTSSNAIGSVGSPGGILTNEETVSGQGGFGLGGLEIMNKGTISAVGGTLTLEPNSSGVTNSGTLQATTGATLAIIFGSPAPINNAGGTIHAQTGAIVIINGPIITGGSLTTSGTGVFQTPGGGGSPTLNGVDLAGVFQLESSASAILKGTVANTGTIQLLGGAQLSMSGPVTLSGGGSITMSNVTSNIITASGGVGTLISHNMILGSGAIELAFTNEGTVEANQPVPLVIFSSLFGSGEFKNTGTLIANAGSTLQVEGAFTNLAAGTLTGGTYKVNGTLELPGDITTNSARITLTGTTSQILDASLANALAKLASNSATGSFTLAGNQNFSSSGGFSNAGTVKISTGSTFKASSYTQTKGATTVNGSLVMMPSTGAINLNGGSLFGGGGTLTGKVTSIAVVTPANSATATGKLAINGTYTQNSSGALDVRFASTKAFSQVNVSGAVALGGTLNISFPTSFAPTIGSTFTILTGSSVTGKFATVTGLSINSTEHFQVTYNANNVTLTVVSGA